VKGRLSRSLRGKKPRLLISAWEAASRWRLPSILLSRKGGPDSPETERRAAVRAAGHLGVLRHVTDLEAGFRGV